MSVANVTSRFEVTLLSPNQEISTGIHILDSSHIKVYRRRETPVGSGIYVPTLLTLGSDYAVEDVGIGAGCTVTTISQAAGDVVTGFRSIPHTQSGEYGLNTAFPPTTNEDGHDLSSMRDQQLLEEIDRCIQFPEDETLGVDENVIPSQVNRANKLLGFGALPDAQLTAYDADTVLSGLSDNRASYSVLSQGTKQFLTAVPASDTTSDLEIWLTVGATGRMRYRRYTITNVDADVSAIVTSTANDLSGKTGEEAVNVTVLVTGKSVLFTIDATDAQNSGNGLQATRTVSVMVKTTQVSTSSDLPFIFAV